MSGRWRIDPARARQARPFRDRDRRGAAARAQRSAALRLGRSRARPTSSATGRRSRRSARSRSGGFDARDLQAALAGRTRADQAAAARPADRRRARQYLCLRGAVPGAASHPRARRRVDLARRGSSGWSPAIQDVLDEAIAAGGSTLARLRQPRRRARLFLEELRGLRSRGRSRAPAAGRSSASSRAAARPSTARSASVDA